MAMTYDRFVGLSKRLEADASASPRSYRVRLGLLAALGYAYILVILGMAVGLVGVMAWFCVSSHRCHGLIVQLGIALLIFAGIIVRALWVRLPGPVGVPLTAEEAPELFAVADDLCARLRTAGFRRVLLDGDYNAAVVQLPRLGLLGWTANYLIVGLPCLQSLSRDQVRSVLAHEIGHISANHGRFVTWIERLRATWGRLMEELEQRQHRWTFLVSWFSNWYGPYFMAYSFVLARAHEREADRSAAALTSPQAAGEALAIAAVHDRFLEEEFWPAAYREVNERAEPPAGVYGELMRALRSPLPEAKADRWLAEALAPDTGFDDTHPSLRERLASFGYPGARDEPEVRRALLAGPPGETAAELFFGDRLARYAQAVDSLWREAVGPQWAQRRQAAQEAKRELEELARKADAGALGREDAWQRARLAAEFGDPEELGPLLRDIVSRWPEFAPGRYLLGQHLLSEDDASGLELVEEAMNRDPDLVPSGCEIMCAFLRGKGRNLEAEGYRRRGAEEADRQAVAEREERRFSRREVFLPHDLPPDAVARLLGGLSTNPEVKEAYLVRRQLPSRPDRITYLLGVVPQFRGFVVSDARACQALLERIVNEMEVPESTMTAIVYGSLSGLGKRLRTVQGARIWSR